MEFDARLGISVHLLSAGAGDDNPHIKGVAPYWRLAYQTSSGLHYFLFGAFGLDALLQPDPTVPDKDRYTDVGFDAVYQYTDGGH